MGLIEPINSRITDARYYLDSPHQGRTPAHTNSPQRPSLVRNHAALDFSLNVIWLKRIAR